MQEAHARARRGDGPTLIECKTYRFLPHTSDDDDKTYRSREEVAEHKHHDPIDRFTAYLIAQGLLAITTGCRRCTTRSRPRSTPRSRPPGTRPTPIPPPPWRHVFAEDERREPRRISSPRSATRSTTEMAADDRIVLLGEDVGARGGVFKVSEGFMRRVRRGSA